jgi:hypothetical protein
MKFTKQDYSLLSGAIKIHLSLYTMEEINQARQIMIDNPNIKRDYISLIWAIFFKVKKYDETINDMIYTRTRNGTYNDNHIETALKHIFKEYGIEE